MSGIVTKRNGTKIGRIIINGGALPTQCDLNVGLTVSTGGLEDLGSNYSDDSHTYWEIIEGPGSGVGDYFESTHTWYITVSMYGVYNKIRYKYSDGLRAKDYSCEFYQQPVANPGTGGNAAGLIFQLSAVPDVGIGTWTKTAGSGTATFSPNANTPDAMVTVSTYEVYTFTWTEANGPCTNNASANVSFIVPDVVDSVVGYSHQLDTIDGIDSSTFGWKCTGTNQADCSYASFDDHHLHNATVTVSEYGDYYFYWQRTEGPEYYYIKVTFSAS